MTETKTWLQRWSDSICDHKPAPEFMVADLDHYTSEPGPWALVCEDGGFLCAACGRQEPQVRQVLLGIQQGDKPSREQHQWWVVGVQSPAKGHGDVCDNCYVSIP